MIQSLQEWKVKNNRKPLIIRGARQVGKTTVVNLFAKNFKHYIYLNLDNIRDREIFSQEFSIDELLRAISIFKKTDIIPDNTLLFIDEIQNSPIAIRMLRYFYEQRKDIFVISAGSLLEVTLSEKKVSFPVGRVEYMYLYPLTFSEFLMAKRENELLSVLDEIPVRSIYTSSFNHYFQTFVLIGGMPEIVLRHIEEDQINVLNSTFESLLSTYIDDSAKYAKNSTQRSILLHCLESLPFEVGNRIKFQYFGKSNYRSREISEALRTLERAMLVYLIYPTTHVSMPLMEDKKKSPKLQFLDTGMLNYYLGIQSDLALYSNLHAVYRGITAEHIVRQELHAQNLFTNRKLPFWVREQKQSNSEIDFLFPFEGMLIPIEVKSGKTGTLKSLHQFINRSSEKFAVRIYSGQFEILDTETPEGKPYRLMNLPFFLIGKINKYLKKYI